MTSILLLPYFSTIDYLSTKGRCSQGKKSEKWFGYIHYGMKIPTSKLVLCEYCAKNYFEEGKTYEEIDTIALK